MGIIIWVLFGLIGLSIGLKKGINPALAIIAGILLGPLSFLMYFVTPEAKQCPKCAEMIKREAKVCKHCGNEFLFAPDVIKAGVQVKQNYEGRK